MAAGLAGLVLAGVAALAGCILTSGQIAVSFAFQDPLVVSGPSVAIPIQVDLNTISEYNDHKDKLHDLADLALLGEIENRGSAALQIEFWLTPAPTNHVLASQVRNDTTAIPLWGPLPVGAGARQRIDWNASAALFSGRRALLDQVKGDGEFTLYALAPSGALTFDFVLHHGVLVVIVDAGV
jgi:hypothetical protein